MISVWVHVGLRWSRPQYPPVQAHSSSLQLVQNIETECLITPREQLQSLQVDQAKLEFPLPGNSISQGWSSCPKCYKFALPIWIENNQRFISGGMTGTTIRNSGWYAMAHLEFVSRFWDLKNALQKQWISWSYILRNHSFCRPLHADTTVGGHQIHWTFHWLHPPPSNQPMPPPPWQPLQHLHPRITQFWQLSKESHVWPSRGPPHLITWSYRKVRSDPPHCFRWPGGVLASKYGVLSLDSTETC